MAFCKYCGTPLAEGQVCGCTQSQTNNMGNVNINKSSEPVQPQMNQVPMGQFNQPQMNQYVQPQVNQYGQPQMAQPNANVETVKRSVNETRNYLTGYFKNPANAVRGVVQSNNKLVLIALSILRFLACGLAIWGICSKVCKTAYSTVVDNMGFLGGMAESAGTGITAPFIEILLWGSLVGVVGFALFALMMFAMTKVTKSNVDFMTTVKVCLANSPLTIVLMLLSFVLSFIHLGASIACLLLSAILWMITGVLTAQILNQDNVSGKFWLTYIVGCILVFVLAYFVMPTFLTNSFGAITVNAMGYETNLKGFLEGFAGDFKSAGGFSGLFSELIGDIF